MNVRKNISVMHLIFLGTVKQLNQYGCEAPVILLATEIFILVNFTDEYGLNRTISALFVSEI